MVQPKPQTPPEEAGKVAGIAAAMVAQAAASEASGGSTRAARDAAIASLILSMLPVALVNRYPEAIASAITDALALAGGAIPVAGVYTDGVVGQRMYSSEILMRARYVWAATKRLIAARKDGDLKAGLGKERGYLSAHHRMVAHRRAAARTLDEAVKRWGLVLSWNAMLDGSTTPECRDASGKNFDVRKPPRIGVPGIGPHGGCRCWPGPPRPGAPMI